MPQALEQFLNNQRPVGLGLDYNSFTRKRELRLELIAHQHGLCALTGAPVDERLGPVAPDGQITAASGAKLKIKVHNAHLKPQSVCRQEIIARGDEPGRVVGEDMDHRNIVAALLIEGAAGEMFGAAAQENHLLQVRPTDPGCDARFYFDGNGRVDGLDGAAQQTVETLKLNHRTLEGWRREAIETFVDPEKLQSPADLDAIIAAMEAPANGKLPAYCFAIKQIAERLKV